MSLREFVASRARHTRWPTVREFDKMDNYRFEAYVQSIGFDKKIEAARTKRQP